MEHRNRVVTLTKAEAYDTLAAIWVIACNDEDPIITYRGLNDRIPPDPHYDVEDIVASRPELFRKGGVPAKRFNRWKEKMRNKPPPWLRDIEDDSDREAAIEELRPAHIFRSQFRVKEDAPPSPIDIIDWGLQHIERIRQARVEASSKLATKKQFNLVLAVSILNIIVTFIATSATAYVGG
jgi:hypothetical protein